MSVAKEVIAIFAIAGSLCWCPQTMAEQPKTSEKSEWIFIASNRDDTRFYSGKRGSFEIVTTKGGTQAAMVLGQIDDRKDNTITYNKWYVSTSDCQSGIGKLVALKVGGDFDFEADYVAKGESIASSIADTICAVYRSDTETKEAKGI
jgi:hypothetical protein